MITEAPDRDFMVPYISLAKISAGPMHAMALLSRAYPESDTHAHPVPAQIVQPARFRASLAAQVAPRDCPVNSPAELAADQRTPAWVRLMSCQGSGADASGGDRNWAADLLFRLGFFNSYLTARAQWPVPVDADWRGYLKVLDQIAKHRVGRDVDERRSALASLARDESLWPAARLLAAATLMVGAATGPTAEAELVTETYQATGKLAGLIEDDPGDDPARLYLSTYWRAAAFVPFLDGDYAETMRWLDRSLEFAQPSGDADPDLSLAAAMTRYPVLETRARVLRNADRCDEALMELRTLSALDPFDARVFLKLGDTYTHLGYRDEAEACYQRAVTLGPPLAPLAHLSLARHYRAVGNRQLSSEHLAVGRRLDPGWDQQSAVVARRADQHLEADVPAPLVTPDRQRAVEIQQATMRQRRRMLRYLVRTVGESASQLMESAADEMASMPEDAQRRLLCGPSFSLWLAEAIRPEAGDPASVARDLATVIRASVMANDPAPLERVPAVAVRDALFDRFVNRINDADRARGGRADVVLTDSAAHVGQVRELLSLIERSWPELDREINEIISVVQPFTSHVKTAITNASLHGALFIRVPFTDDAVALDRFVHEAAHVLLNLALEVRPCHDGPPGATMPSPFRAGPRPVEGVLHGAYVFTRAAIALARAEGAMTSPASAVRRIQRSMTIVTSALTLLEDCGRLNDYGQQVAADVRTSARELISDFGMAQF